MGRSGEMRITRFLHNAAVTVTEMMGTAFARTASRVAGRHVLALQDTTSVRAGGSGAAVALHAVLAVDAGNGGVLGAIDAAFFVRTAGKRANRKALPQSQKESQRWLDGAHGAARLRHAGAACVSLTLVDTREINPPLGTAPAHWRLLTTHKVGDAADARQITDWYRQRWTIEQLFRTLKTSQYSKGGSRSKRCGRPKMARSKSSWRAV